MNEENLVERMEYCVSSSECVKCPNFQPNDLCVETMFVAAIDAIKNKNSKIDELQHKIASRNSEIERLKHNIELLAICKEDLPEQTAKAIETEAIKEFIKRFEKKIKDVKFTIGQTWEIQSALKEAKKEMVGDTCGQ